MNFSDPLGTECCHRTNQFTINIQAHTHTYSVHVHGSQERGMKADLMALGWVSEMACSRHKVIDTAAIFFKVLDVVIMSTEVATCISGKGRMVWLDRQMNTKADKLTLIHCIS